MNRREFQFNEGSSNKFWSIELREQSFIVHYGRVGTHGQAQEKSFASAEAAQKEHDKLIIEKTKKGYVEVQVGDASHSRPVPGVKKVEPKESATIVTSEPAPTPPPASLAHVATPLLKREIQLPLLSRYVVTWEEHLPLTGISTPANSLGEMLAHWQSTVNQIAYRSNTCASRIHESYLPYVTPQDRAELRAQLKGKVPPTLPVGYYVGWEPAYYVAAAIGMPDEVTAFVAHIPTGYYQPTGPDSWNDHYHQPQWLVFGLPSRALVLSEFKRLKLRLRSQQQATAWLALTGLEGLDTFAESVCLEGSKQPASELASVIDLISAPEAAPAALLIAQQSKAPQVGQKWLVAHPEESAVGLAPLAMSSGRQAEAAREYLHTMRRSGQSGVLSAALPHVPESVQPWLQREIIDHKDEALPDMAQADMPADLAAAFHGTKGSKAPGWLAVVNLPPVKITGHRLSEADLTLLLSALRDITLGVDSTTPSIVETLKHHADPVSLDAFAWKLFEQWLSMGAPSKDKWAMGAIGHLGGDGSVLKLTPMIRDWPGESQHQRAVFGLEVLRTAGTDTALMCLNGIAQKLKFKGLKEKAQLMMEGIAQARGLTREQLADRMVPDCGLDEQGGRVFDFGPRQFKFVLGAEMKPLVRDAAGKMKTDLPSPNSSDDKEKAEAAVAAWKLLKKTLKEALKIQAERLEDAMITGRRWTPEEFHTLLIKHPLMVNLARQLVFGCYDGTGAVQSTFRITEDQSLADSNDDPCDLPSAGSIGVVHPAHLDEAAKSAWGQVLSDYEIIPPFQQLGREICRAESGDLELKEITRFKGPKIPGITLYGILERSHWVKDTPADGGGFMQHSKHFPAANVTAFIQYTGMSIGYYEEPQEIESVYFVPGHVKPDWWGNHDNKLPIKSVDPVVVSEVLRLVHVLAAKGE